MVGLETRIRKTKVGLPGVLRKGRRWLAGKYREVPLLAASLRRRFDGGPVSGVRPENIV